MTHFGGYIDWGLAWLRKSRTKTAPWHVFCAAEERLHGYGDRGTCPTGFVTIHWQLRPELGEGATTNINCLQKTWVSKQLLAMLTLWSILPLSPSGPWVTGCSSRICGCATRNASSGLRTYRFGYPNCMLSWEYDGIWRTLTTFSYTSY